MDAGFAVAMEQGVGEVSAVVDDDIVLLEHRKVEQGTVAFVAMGDEVEIEGQLRFELVEAAQ